MSDPFTVLDAHNWPQWTCGDTFKVYPGADGPIDSIRWEALAEALQDYAILQTLGVDRDDVRLKPIRSFRNFPKTEAWRKRWKRELLRERGFSRQDAAHRTVPFPSNA